jgi:hypothetical protein
MSNKLSAKNYSKGAIPFLAIGLVFIILMMLMLAGFFLIYVVGRGGQDSEGVHLDPPPALLSDSTSSQDSTFSPNANTSSNVRKLLDKANSTHWGQDGDGSGCWRADRALVTSTFPGAAQNNLDGGKQSYVDRTLPPTNRDLNEASKLLSEGKIPVWEINGEYSGQHWIIITDIDANKNITFLDPNGNNGNGSLRTEPYNKMVGDKGWAYFGRTPSYSYPSDAYLRGVYFTP